MHSPNETAGAFLLVFVILPFCVIVAYLIPTWIAFIRGHHAKWSIFIVNIFAGWSGFGWIACLFWAVSAIDQREYRYNRRHD